MHHRFDLSDVPPARRAQALALKREAWNPVTNARYWSGWQGGIAQVWAWPGDDPDLLSPDDDVPVPESALDAPGENEARLMATLDGFEGQVWHHGILTHSRWWPQRPEQRQWDKFLRGAHRAPEPLPEPQTPVWRLRPWARFAAAGQGWWLQNERSVVTTTAMVLALALGWQLGGLWQAQRAVAAEQARLEALEQSSAVELAARERALAEQARAIELMALRPSHNVLALVDKVTAEMPADASLREWRYEPGQLVFLLQTPTPPEPEPLVRAFEGVEGIESVLAERGRPENTLELRAALSGQPSR